MSAEAIPVPRDETTIYGKIFWMSYIANACGVTANALTFRFAEFINLLRGSEVDAGAMVSVGVLAAILSRFALGPWMDRHGTRWLWRFSTILLIACSLCFAMQTRLGWPLYVLRIGFSTALAGMFSASIVHIQNLAPPHRRTEIIGSLGSSGFIGMITGPFLGDLIFRSFPEGPTRYHALFVSAAIFGMIYLSLIWIVTLKESHSQPETTQSALRLLRQYWPGPIGLVALMMGLGFTVVSVFLTRYATTRGFRDISFFFSGYAVSAFIFRLGSRSLPDVIGRHRMVLIGLLGIGLGQYLFLLVRREWHLLFPALSCGFGHALLFPAVISLGAGKFPRQYRGTATTLILGFTELGTVLLAPVLGAIIDFYGFPQMFFTTGTTILSVALFYQMTAARTLDIDYHEPPPNPTFVPEDSMH